MTAHKLDHYYEVDLLALLQSGNVNDFLYFYVFFRRAAFDQQPLSINAILQESIDYAEGIGESLKVQVYEALRLIAQGFLDYPLNALTPNEPDTLKQVYDNALILLYRLLFVLYAEARDLLSLQSSDLYREYYSLASTKEQIAEHLAEPRGICRHGGRGQRGFDSDSSSGSNRLRGCDGVLDDGRDVDGFHANVERSEAYARDVEHLVDDRVAGTGGPARPTTPLPPRPPIRVSHLPPGSQWCAAVLLPDQESFG